MKMRNRTKLYLLFMILGAVVLIGDVALRNYLAASAKGILSGIGSALMGFGIAKFFVSRLEEKHPQQMKQNQIDLNDERNVMIRHRAQAVSGTALQWFMFAVAWVCIVVDGPLWVTLTALGAFLGKIFLEIGLTAYYQNKM